MKQNDSNADKIIKREILIWNKFNGAISFVCSGERAMLFQMMILKHCHEHQSKLWKIPLTARPFFWIADKIIPIDFARAAIVPEFNNL